MFYLYGIYNSINGKLYIGVTSNYRVRWSSHKKLAKNGNIKKMYTIHFALRKYGIENFVFKPIEEIETWEHALTKETLWIKILRELGYQLYNETNGGEGTRGFKMSEENKKKLSERSTGEKNFFYGKKLSGSANGHFGHKMKPHVKDNLLKHRAKITPAQAEEIKNLHQNGKTQTALAEQFGLSLTQIHRIIKEIRWTNGQSSIHKVKPRLTETQVKEIRELYATEKLTYAKLSEQFNVSQAQLSRIINKKKWTQVK